MNTILDPPLTAPGVTCEHCQELIEAWQVGQLGVLSWRHAATKTTECTVTTTYQCRPYDGWDAERRVRAAQREAWDDDLEVESLADAETSGRFEVAW